MTAQELLPGLDVAETPEERMRRRIQAACEGYGKKPKRTEAQRAAFEALRPQTRMVGPVPVVDPDLDGKRLLFTLWVNLCEYLGTTLDEDGQSWYLVRIIDKAPWRRDGVALGSVASLPAKHFRVL